MSTLDATIKDDSGETRIEGSVTLPAAALGQLAAGVSGTVPEIPATPDAQDVTDALVALGLATQAT